MAAPDRPAALRPGLLARKGEARPAMRPNGLAAALVADDDLGWNDFGGDVPPVLRQRAQLESLTLGSDALSAPVPGAGAEPVTVVLDADRLWRLRVAAAARNQTVDAWLCDAIDLILSVPSDGTTPDPLPKVQP